MTFNQKLAEWLLVRSTGKKQRTIEFYQDVQNIILANWQDTASTIDAITPETLLSFAQLVAHHCPSRWNTIVAAMRYVTPHGNLLKRKRANVREFVPPGQSQFERLLAECDAAPRSHAGLIVRFLSLTGLRISEARGLVWKNVFENTIFVPANLSKSGKSRSIPRIPGVGEVLNRLRRIGEGEFVLPRQHPRKAIETACRKAGLPRMSPHCFRHYFTTRCIESGVDMPTVARWLGHQDGGALLSKTYFHLIDEHSRRMAEKVRIV